MRSSIVRLALSISIFSTVLSAQILTGTLTGEVADPTGARIAGVSVSAKNLDTNLVYRAQANDTGVYALTLLPTGNYELRVEAAGFRPFVRTGLQLGADQRLRVNVQLELGGVTEAVTVGGEAPLLKTEEATLGTRFNATSFENLPVSRSATNVLRTVPGVIPNPSGYANGLADGDINGGRSATSSILVDGVSTEFTNLNVSGGGTGQPGYMPILEAVDEVTIQTANYSAEIGRGGASVQITTRPGTNTFHGALFHFFQNDKLNANSFFNNLTGASRPQQRYNLFGGTLGGPVFIPNVYDGHNRTFFTFAYEGTRQISYATPISTVPTSAMRAGDFSGLAGIYDPASFQPAGGGVFSATPFPDNRIPSTRFAAQSTAMLPYYPAPNLPGSVANYSYIQSLPSNMDSINLRGDHTFSDKNRATVRYGRISNTTQNSVRYPGPAGAGSDSAYLDAMNVIHNLSASHTYVFTPTTVNDFRFGYFQVYGTTGGPGQSEGWAQKLGFPQISGDKFPLVNLSTYGSFGVSHRNVAYLYPARNFDIVDTVSLLRGRHSIKIGGQYRTLVFFDGRGTGVSFSFDTQGTYNPLTGATRASTGNSFA
ncbi:MAG: Plug and carboxypeptidase regulatory-like domain-containing protein, partial [Acidobacteria bacterium]|nr:Plug and carboxypeptidase regulatory-like domain-containing protein [Acidobacteriota bacterium]